MSKTMVAAAVVGKPLGQLRQIPMGELVEAPWNARTDFGSLAELEASIREEGILNPLIARPHGDDTYEVFCGHRRLRAARFLGLSEVPVIVRPCGDQEARSLAVIDNLQREGLGPMDEARAFWELKKLGLNAAEIAARCVPERAAGVAYVHSRMALLDLPEDAQDMVRSGALPLVVATAILRLAPERHAAAVKEVRAFEEKQQSQWGRQPTPSELVGVVRGLMRTLKEAGFDLDDPTLNKARGSCRTCRFRTGNQAGLFGVVAGDDDSCTDSACFRLKLDETFRRRAEEHQDKGLEVLPAARAAKLWPYKNNPHNLDSGYVTLDEKVFVGSGAGVQVKAALAHAPDKAPRPVLAQNPHTGLAVELLPRQAVEKLARSLAASKEARARRGDETTLTKAERQERLKRQQAALQARVNGELMLVLADAVASAAEARWAVLAGNTGQLGGELHALARCVMDRVSHEARCDAALRRRWAEKRSEADYETFWGNVAKLEALQAIGLAAELLVWHAKDWLPGILDLKERARHRDFDRIDRPVLNLLEELGVDGRGLRAQVEKRLREEQDQKAFGDRLRQSALPSSAEKGKAKAKPTGKRKGQA